MQVYTFPFIPDKNLIVVGGLDPNHIQATFASVEGVLPSGLEANLKAHTPLDLASARMPRVRDESPAVFVNQGMKKALLNIIVT